MKGTRLSRKLDGVSESATLKLNSTVQALRAQGVPVANLTAGEPDFMVPEAAKQAAIDAVRADRSKYTPVPGIPELRQAIADKTNRQQPSVAKSRAWKGADVVVTNGGKQALFNAFMALLDAGDEVLIPSPYWLSYPEMTRLAGGTPRFVDAPFSQGFKVLPAQLRSAIGPKTRVVVFNSPSNPTGAMYSRAEFEALAAVIREKASPDLWVISDEIYDQAILGAVPFASFLDCAPDLRERVITVNGMSKSAAMTGWRIGWSVAPETLTQAMITLQGQCTSGINAPAQWASLAALALPEELFAAQADVFKKRRDLVLEKLRKASKMDVLTPEGAFYAFVGVGAYLKDGEDTIALAQDLLEKARVAVVPGTPFGAPTFLRLSFATDERTLTEGCERLVQYLESR